MDKREKFLAENSLDGGFLQSEYWMAFQAELKQKFYLVESEENQVLVIENKLSLVGKYFYLPRGPIFSENKKDNQVLIKKIKDLAIKNKIGWIRMEPQRKADLSQVKEKLIKAYKNHQPAETLSLDLALSLDEILAGMKQKTRYNVRLAEKKGIKVEVLTDSKNLEIFWKLAQETAQRDGASFHGKQYYQKMFKAIPAENLKLLVAFSGSQPVGAIIISFFGGVATYLHGASANKHRNLMANYFLQWEAIKYAKEWGALKYDFFGIAVELNRKKWLGITRFKTGFCSKCEPTIFPGCYDLILNPLKYWIYRILQFFK